MKIQDISQNARDLLAWPFDFSIDEIPSDPIWFRAEPPTKLLPIAGEGSGGVYALIEEDGSVLFVDSEGSGGIVAPSLEAFLQIIVSHPYWRDLLKFSGGGDLVEMKKAAAWASSQYKCRKSYPEADSALRQLEDILKIRSSDESLEVLHASISNSSNKIRLFAPDGSELESLFNSFTAHTAN